MNDQLLLQDEVLGNNGSATTRSDQLNQGHAALRAGYPSVPEARTLLFIFQFNIGDMAQFFHVFGRNLKLWLAELLQNMPRQTRNFLIA